MKSEWITYDELAKELGISKKTLQNKTSGKNKKKFPLKPYPVPGVGRRFSRREYKKFCQKVYKQNQ